MAIEFSIVDDGLVIDKTYGMDGEAMFLDAEEVLLLIRYLNNLQVIKADDGTSTFYDFMGNSIPIGIKDS